VFREGKVTPTDGTAAVGDADADRVIRGGSWYGGARGVRSARRRWNPPGDRDDFVGFRCARVLVSRAGG